MTAAVAATMLAVAALKPAVAVTAYVPLAENMVSGSAYRPGDVIRLRAIDREKSNLALSFDHVIIATNASDVTSLLEDAAQEEARIYSEILSQRARLVFPGFFSATPWRSLVHLPRYLKALDRRLAKYPENAQRDSKHAEAVAVLWQRYWQREEANRAAGRREPALDAFRWLIEELRVSLFAQELRTPFPVSYKRLEKAWKEISAG